MTNAVMVNASVNEIMKNRINKNIIKEDPTYCVSRIDNNGDKNAIKETLAEAAIITATIQQRNNNTIHKNNILP